MFSWNFLKFVCHYNRCMICKLNEPKQSEGGHIAPFRLKSHNAQYIFSIPHKNGLFASYISIFEWRLIVLVNGLHNFNKKLVCIEMFRYFTAKILELLAFKEVWSRFWSSTFYFFCYLQCFKNVL